MSVASNRGTSDLFFKYLQIFHSCITKWDTPQLPLHQKTKVITINSKKLKIMEAKKLFFKECHLAGRQYHDVDEVWDELHIGTLLELVRDTDNAYDKNAFTKAIEWCWHYQSMQIAKSI